MNGESKLVKIKFGFLTLVENFTNVSQSCKVIGYIQDGFCQINELYDTKAVLKMAFDFPVFDQQ